MVSFGMATEVMLPLSFPLFHASLMLLEIGTGSRLQRSTRHDAPVFRGGTTCK